MLTKIAAYDIRKDYLLFLDSIPDVIKDLDTLRNHIVHLANYWLKERDGNLHVFYSEQAAKKYFPHYDVIEVKK